MRKDDQAERVWSAKTRPREKPGRPVYSDSSVLCPLCVPFFPPEGWIGAFSNGQGLMIYCQTRKVRYFPKGWFQGRKEIRIIFLGFGKRVLVAMACLWGAGKDLTFLSFTWDKKEECKTKGKVGEKFCFNFWGFHFGCYFPSSRRPKRVTKFSQNQHRWGWSKVTLPEMSSLFVEQLEGGQLWGWRVEAGERNGEATENQEV